MNQVVFLTLYGIFAICYIGYIYLYIERLDNAENSIWERRIRPLLRRTQATQPPWYSR